MKKGFAIVIALVGLSFLFSGCLVINVEKSESKEKKPAATTSSEQGSTEQPAK